MEIDHMDGNRKIYWRIIKNINKRKNRILFIVYKLKYIINIDIIIIIINIIIIFFFIGKHIHHI